jgi:hypothetical protein
MSSTNRSTRAIPIKLVIVGLGFLVAACLLLFAACREQRSVNSPTRGQLILTEKRMRLVAKGCDRFHSINGFWPTNDVMMLSCMPSGIAADLTDGWGWHFQFYISSDQQSMTIFSVGKDGALGGVGDDADASLNVK